MPTTAQTGPLGLPIGIQLYTVNDAMLTDTPATLRQLAEMGYGEVETAGYGTLPSAREFRNELDANGLKCPSGHFQFDMADLNKAFDDAHTLGCRYVTTSVPRMLLWPYIEKPYELTPEQMVEVFSKVLAPMPPDEFVKTAEAMNKVGEAAKAAGLVFAAHNHTMEFGKMGDETGLDYLIKNTADHIKYELDCGWATLTKNDPVGLVNRYPGRITLLHAKDFAPHEGVENPTFGTVGGMELGRGVINYVEIFAGLQGKGIEHVFVEQDAPFSRMPSIESARVNFDFLKTIA